MQQRGWKPTNYQNRGWNEEVRDCRWALIAKRREENEGEVHGGKGKSVGGSTPFLTSLASPGPLRAALGPQQMTQLASQSHIIGPGTWAKLRADRARSWQHYFCPLRVLVYTCTQYLHTTNQNCSFDDLNFSETTDAIDSDWTYFCFIWFVFDPYYYWVTFHNSNQ